MPGEAQTSMAIEVEEEVRPSTWASEGIRPGDAGRDCWV